MKKLRRTIEIGLFLLLISFLTGCSQKEIVIKKELICFNQQILECSKPSKIYFINALECSKDMADYEDCKKAYDDLERFNKEQVEVLNAEREENRKRCEFYESQVKRNNELCLSESRKDDNNDSKKMEER